MLCGFLSSCAPDTYLPRFDGGVLNPDIQFLRAGDVMNGMKCAFVEFMDERDHQLFEERIRIYRGRNDTPEQQGEYLLRYAAEYEKLFAGIQRKVRDDRYRPRTWSGKDAEYTPYALNVGQNIPDWKKSKAGSAQEKVFAAFTAKGLIPPTEGQMLEKELECNDRNSAEALDPSDLRHWEAWEWDRKSKKPIITGRCVRNKELCSDQLGVVLWDYKAKDRFSRQYGRSDDVTVGNCARIPDYSRFALDPTQQAKIDLTLLGTTQGTVFYKQIDATALGPLSDFIAAGNRQLGVDFPVVNLTSKSSTTFQLVSLVPQTVFVAAPADAGKGDDPAGVDIAGLHPGARQALAAYALDAASKDQEVERENPQGARGADR
jgi:hypothetical protein